MSELKIIVIGGTGQGKSAVAQSIAEYLTTEGFNVTNNDDDQINYPVDNEIQNIRFDTTLLKNSNIEILTQHLLRDKL